MDEQQKLSIELVIALLNNAEKELLFTDGNKDKNADFAIRIKRRKENYVEYEEVYTLTDLLQYAYTDINGFKSWTTEYIEQQEQSKELWARIEKNNNAKKIL